MKVTVNTISETKKELLIEVPADVLKKAVDKETANVRKKVQIPGFRKGKAPLSLINKQYGQQIEATAIEDAINEQYRAALVSEGLSPLAPADISDMDYKPGEMLKFKATLEIEPEIKVESWDGMKVEKQEIEISDELIDQTLEQVRKQHATIKVKEDPIANGDQVLVEFSEVDPSSGVEIIGKKYPDRSFRVGDQTYGPDFDEAIVGMSLNESKIVKRPLEQYIIVDPNRDVSKPAREEAWRVTINRIEEVELPAIDEEFAKTMNYDDPEKLREGIGENLKRQYEDSNAQSFRANIEREAVRIANPPAPEAMVERYLDNLIETFKRMSQRPTDLNKLREESKGSAEFKVKWFLVRDYIMRSESISVTDEEVDTYLKEAAEKNNMDYERLRIEYRSGDKRENLRNDLLDKKVYDFLESKSEVSIIQNK